MKSDGSVSAGPCVKNDDNESRQDMTPSPQDARPQDATRESENENQRPSGKEGEEPRPATEPRGAEGSSNSGETATDPATGAPNP